MIYDPYVIIKPDGFGNELHFTLQPYCNVPTTLKPKSYLNPRQVGDKVVSCDFTDNREKVRR